MTITKLRYVGGGATRGQIVARDYDGGEVARMDPAAAQGMVASGLWAAESDEETPPAEIVPANPLEGLTKAQLVALADERGVVIDPHDNKATIAAALEAAGGEG